MNPQLFDVAFILAMAAIAYRGSALKHAGWLFGLVVVWLVVGAYEGRIVFLARFLVALLVLAIYLLRRKATEKRA